MMIRRAALVFALSALPASGACADAVSGSGPSCPSGARANRHGEPDVYFRRFDTTGAPVDPVELRVSDEPARSERAVIAGAPTSWAIVWDDARGGARQLFFRRVDP